MKTLYFVACTLLMLSQTCFAEFKIGIVFDKGGKDDKSFNAAAYAGVMKAKDEFKAIVKYVEPTDENAFEPQLRSFAQKKFDLILAIGFPQVEAVKKVAAQFPNVKFGIFDGEVNAPNVRSHLFAEHEGSYLVGAIAAMTSKTGKVGFIGGMDIPLIRRFATGYEGGAKKINPKVQVTSNYIGITGDAWNNPAKAKELAFSQYATGIDVIFAAAGASGTGAFDAAEEKKKFAIGVDSNQNWVKPGSVLTSMVKRVDVAVFTTCEDVFKEKFTPGLMRFDLKNHGVDYAVDKHNEKLLPENVIKRAEELRTEIVGGQIQVPDYYKIKR